MTGIDKQKRYFEQLDKVIDEPIYVTRNWKKGKEWVPGKRYLIASYYKAVPPLDHRTIGPNEPVIELDANSYALNYKVAKPILDFCKNEDIPCYVFWSGNKSIHIHFFLEFLNLNYNEDQLKVIKEAYSQGWNIQGDIRLAFTRYILEQSGLSTDLIGHGKIVDLAKLKWNDLTGKATLIRCAGGANIKQKEGVLTTAWKTYYEELPTGKPRKPTHYDDLEYPTKIKKYKLSPEFVVERALKYLKNTPEKRRNQLKTIKYDGKYLSNPCIQMLLEGQSEGKRNQGAKIIAIAARMDKLSKNECKGVIQQYVDNCTQVPEEYTFDEAERWVDWIYAQPEPYWTCSFPQQIGMCDKSLCPYYKKKYEKELALFNTDEPLTIIKEALNELIVGEDKLKMTLFLLYLTKEFDPEWFVLLDGEASSGKSHIMKAVASLFGPEGEGYYSYSRFTKSSLNHLGELADEWANKIVIIEELQGAGDVIEQLRVAISEGKLTLLESVEQKDGGMKRWGSQAKTIFFKNVLFVTCNADNFEDGAQFQSRAWILNTDQTRLHTKAIIKDTWKQFSIPKRNKKEINVDMITQSLKILRKPSEVIFPFGEELNHFTPSKTVRGRRDVKKMASLIKASAYFHQRNRTWAGDILIADWRDAMYAFMYAGDTLNASSQGIGERDLKYYEAIVACSTHQPVFQNEDVVRWCGVSIHTARRVMGVLESAGFFENTEHRKGYNAIYEKTGVSPDYLGDVAEFCRKKAENQENDIKEVLNAIEK
ncbi:hypothetical protein CMI37_29320 [Candidatus Pacearchaeota archaeon]|nr:hypothetical protein [Candidatus Pacearchaeota archaeon]|tara:strand:+ start:2001 stop:4289 length:2289 start_codon:yes stop_codon:yes gene_type:complete